MGILLPPFLLYLIIKTFQKREEQGSFKRLELIDRLVIKVKRAEQKRSYSMLIKRLKAFQKRVWLGSRAKIDEIDLFGHRGYFSESVNDATRSLSNVF
jgi:hypothetical protein